jgi:putative membrane protein
VSCGNAAAYRVSVPAPLLTDRILAHGTAGDLTPRFTPARLFTATTVEAVPMALIIFVGALYLWGQWRLWQRGDRWSGLRSTSFIVGGLGSIAFATQSGLGAYDDKLFSTHMTQHMILSMVAPVFLALGAPVTLALRTLPGRSRGMLLAVLHSRVAKTLTFPLIGWALFVGSPFALYFSGWYPATLDHRWMHELLHIHFLLVGCIFLWPLIGLDPVPGKVAYPLRFMLVFAALPFHAILGISIMDSQQLIAGSHYIALQLPWSDPYSDQRVGGGLLWASGDLVGLLLLGSVTVQWMRASEREAAREDRKLDRLAAARAARHNAAGAAGRTAADQDAEGVEPLLMPVWWETPEAAATAPAEVATEVSQTPDGGPDR